MDDVTPELLANVEKSFNEMIKNDSKIAKILKRISDGGNYDDANVFAQRYGELLSRALKLNISGDDLPDGKMYFNIAQKLLNPLLDGDYNAVADICETVQTTLNKSAGIGLKAIRPELNKDRIKGFLDRISNEPLFDEVAWIFGEPIVNFSQSVVDDSVKANADFQYKTGLNPQVVRTAERKCCKWCQSLEGIYTYPNVPREVFQRHEACRCNVTYDGSNLKAYTNRRGANNTFRA